MVNLETFEIGSSSMMDIGGDEIDLRSIDLTDTLIGSCVAELNQALGEADANVWERYHLGDASGLSDIELTTFDSALIQDSGIQTFNADTDDENDVSELAELLGKKPKVKVKDDKKEVVTSGLQEFVARCLAEVSSKTYDKDLEAFANDGRYAWRVDDLKFNDKGEFCETDEDCENYTDDDFINEYDELFAIAEDVLAGELSEAFAGPTLTLVK